MRTTFEISAVGASTLIARALELLATIELADAALISDEVLDEARSLRAVVDEWVEFVTIVEPEDLVE